MNPPFVEILENLSVICRSCAEKFESAAAGCEDEARHERFVERAEQFGNYVWDLQEQIHRFGEHRLPERGRLLTTGEEDSKAGNDGRDMEEPSQSSSCLNCIEK